MNPLWIFLFVFAPFLLICACVLYFSIPADDPIFDQGGYTRTAPNNVLTIVATIIWAAPIVAALVMSGLAAATIVSLALILILCVGAFIRTGAESIGQSLANKKRFREGIALRPELPAFSQRFAWNLHHVLVWLPFCLLGP